MSHASRKLRYLNGLYAGIPQASEACGHVNAIHVYALDACCFVRHG